jgi:hypothetical protein
LGGPQRRRGADALLPWRDHGGLEWSGVGVAAWGFNSTGQSNVPSPNTNFVTIATSGSHCLGLKRDGSIVAWGRNDRGQCSIPAPNSNFVAISAGADFGVGLRRSTVDVAFSDVAAEAANGSVLLRWSVALDHPGKLRVLRANEPEGAYQNIGPEIDVAAGRSTSTYQDTAVELGHEYFYKLACREAGPWTYSSSMRV